MKGDFLIGWKITPVFNISQKERFILTQVKKILASGCIRLSSHGVYVYQVDNKNALLRQIIPFFKKHPFLSEKKKKDFSRFIQTVDILYQGNKIQTYSDVVSLCKLLDQVENKSSRK